NSRPSRPPDAGETRDVRVSGADAMPREPGRIPGWSRGSSATWCMIRRELEAWNEEDPGRVRCRRFDLVLTKCACGVVRQPREAGPQGHGDYEGRGRGGGRVQRARGRCAARAEPIQSLGRVLPRGRDADADERLGHQDRGVAAYGPVEWQISGSGQR